MIFYEALVLDHCRLNITAGFQKVMSKWRQPGTAPSRLSRGGVEFKIW